MTRGVLLLSLAALLSFNLCAQDDLAKATQYYDEGRYREALYHLRKVVATDTTNAVVFKMRGNCYYDLNQTDSAKMDYLRAIRLDPKLSASYYNLGNILEEEGHLAGALDYMRKFNKLEPRDADGWARLSLLKQKLNEPDSALYFTEQAYAMDPDNLGTLIMLGWQYYRFNQHQKTLDAIKPAVEKFPDDTNLLGLKASTLFAMGDYKTCLMLLEDLIPKEAEPIPYYSMKVKAEIFLKTQSDKVKRTPTGFAFTGIASGKTGDLDNWVRDADNPYYYGLLKDKFNFRIDEMTLDEIFMAYYGFTTEAGYSPYGATNAKELRQKLEAQAFADLKNLAKTALAKNPFDLAARENLFIAQYSLKEPEFEASLKTYLGLMEAILASGTGTSYDSAYIITRVSDEYDLLYYLGLSSTIQSLSHKDGHNFDIFVFGG
ncbi:MAG: DUF4919 domain-containing protein [Bacteroidia bacterium]|nr:DUF4919 domain-containing protein [Bacteroidia bacterium]